MVKDRYGNLPQALVNKLEEYEHSYFREDKPVPFYGLQIYPIQVRNFEIFSNCTSCLTLNKNETPEGVKMTNLDFLVSKVQSEDRQESAMWSFKLQKLFELIFHISNGIKCKKCGQVMKYQSDTFSKFMEDMQEFMDKRKQIVDNIVSQNTEGNEDINITPPTLKCSECGGTDFLEMIKVLEDPETKKHKLCVDGKIIDNKAFNELRQIVLFQNFYDYADDSMVDSEIKKDHEEKMRLEQQRQDLHASIEKKVVCLSISTHYKFDEIYSMSIRKFTLALATVDDLINYKITKQATLSGFVSLPKGKSIEHWIYKPNKDMYGDSYKSTDQIEESVSNL